MGGGELLDLVEQRPVSGADGYPLGIGASPDLTRPEIILHVGGVEAGVLDEKGSVRAFEQNWFEKPLMLRSISFRAPLTPHPI